MTQHDGHLIYRGGYRIDTAAPYYPLVELADDASNGMRTTARARTTTTTTEAA